MNAWSPTMRVMVRTTSEAKCAISTFWGGSMWQVYNETFACLMGLQHPGKLAITAEDIWGAHWPELEPVLQRVLKEGCSLQLENFLFQYQSKETQQEKNLTLSLSPVYNEEALIEGVLLLAIETPGEVSGSKTNLPASDGQGSPGNRLTSSTEAVILHQFPGNKPVLPEPSEEASNETRAVNREGVEEVPDEDFVLLDSNGIIKTWNNVAESIRQYTEAEIVGQHFSIFYLPGERKNQLPETLLETARVHGRANQEGWLLRKDQTRFWGTMTLTALHDTDGKVTGFSKVIQDLSSQKVADEQVRAFMDELQQVNESLRKSEERYQQMIAEVQDYAIILLDEKANIINWNAGAAAIKGYRADEVIGRNIRIFYTEADKQNSLPEKLFKEAVEKGKALQEGWRLRKDGTAFWGSISITALHNKEGAIIGFSKVTRDLTQKKYAEDKMREYLVELESKNRDLEQFAYLASHDLQEPLRKIQIFIEILQRGGHADTVLQTYLGKIVNSARRMSELIQSVLDYCGLSTNEHKMVTTDFNYILENVKVDLELLIAERKAEIVNQPLPQLKAIPMFVTQLFTNLITNAIKFTVLEPRIAIGSRLVSSDQIAEISGSITGKNYFEISFSDNGIGFDEKYRNQIFSIFQRLHGKNEFPGVGIGLAMCKKIMELHAGFIVAKSELSKGSVFYVYFPAD